MDEQNLVRMANRIGDFFDAMPDQQEAIDDIATHLRKFWEPRMRRRIYQLLDSGQAGELQALVAKALQLHRSELLPQT